MLTKLVIAIRITVIIFKGTNVRIFRKMKSWAGGLVQLDGVDGLPDAWSERGAGLRMLVKIAIFVFGNTLPYII